MIKNAYVQQFGRSIHIYEMVLIETDFYTHTSNGYDHGKSHNNTDTDIVKYLTTEEVLL